jgi:lipopolysaccharide biosynthesis protein
METTTIDDNRSRNLFSKVVRKAAKLIWWTCTFQLGSKLRHKWREHNMRRSKTPHLAPPTDDYCLAVPLGYSFDKRLSPPHLAVICHMFYPEMLDEFQRCFLNIPLSFDLFLTTDLEDKKSAIEKAFLRWDKGKIEVRLAPNRGRDIAPLLITCRDLYDQYEFFLHLHTKKTPHYQPLSNWGPYLLQTLLGSEKIVESVFECFHVDPKLGMIAPQHIEQIRPHLGWGWNFESAKKAARRMGIKISLDRRLDFPSGSMFWARSAALKPLLDCNFSLDEFPNETGQIDGTMSHVIERLFFFSCERAGYRWIKIAQPALHECSRRMRWAESRNELSGFIENYQYDLLESKRRKKSLFQRLGITSANHTIDPYSELHRVAHPGPDLKNADFPCFQRVTEAAHCEKTKHD